MSRDPTRERAFRKSSGEACVEARVLPKAETGGELRLPGDLTPSLNMDPRRKGRLFINDEQI